jgi:hypothetical protein
MAQNKFLSFLNSLDKGASDRNSITEFLANVLTPGDEMEYINGQLMTSGGSPVEDMGRKTSYGTLGQANFAGNDPIKDGLLSKMTEAPDNVAKKFGLLNKDVQAPNNDDYSLLYGVKPLGPITQTTLPDITDEQEFFNFVEKYKDDPLFKEYMGDMEMMRKVFDLSKQQE